MPQGSTCTLTNLFSVQVDLSQNDLGPEGAKAIASGIRDNSSITQALAKGHVLPSPLLYSLTLTSLFLTSMSVHWQVDLRHNEIGGYYNEEQVLVFTPEGPQAIADALSVCSSVTQVLAFSHSDMHSLLY